MSNDINLSDLNHYEFIRYESSDDRFIIFIVSDDKNCGDCCHLNGHLYKVTFMNISELVISGKEADSYIYKNFKFTDNRLSFSLKGINYLDDNTELDISFNFVSYQIEDLGAIKEADA